MEVKSLYVAGPMTGYNDFNFPVFFQAEKKLTEAGYQVHNPAQFEVNPEETWETCMRRDLILMLKTDGIALLDGWHKSRGASLEFHVARSLNIPTDPVSTWITKANEGLF